MRTPAPAAAPIACQVIGTSARVPGGVVGRPAILDDLGGYLLVGKRDRLRQTGRGSEYKRKHAT